MNSIVVNLKAMTIHNHWMNELEDFRMKLEWMTKKKLETIRML